MELKNGFSTVSYSTLVGALSMSPSLIMNKFKPSVSTVLLKLSVRPAQARVLHSGKKAVSSARTPGRRRVEKGQTSLKIHLTDRAGSGSGFAPASDKTNNLTNE